MHCTKRDEQSVSDFESCTDHQTTSSWLHQDCPQRSQRCGGGAWRSYSWKMQTCQSLWSLQSLELCQHFSTFNHSEHELTNVVTTMIKKNYTDVVFINSVHTGMIQNQSVILTNMEPKTQLITHDKNTEHVQLTLFYLVFKNGLFLTD